ncbi:MAG: guanylate kinase [Deltaproteobacteria bacterium]|nr:guanylate kinase [Deltaproteobacteria bacterium]
MSDNERGVLFVISSPSGAGKTTLCRRLMDDFPDLAFSVSFTTRPRRAQEVDGADYHFVDDQTFDEMVAAKAFAEWAPVHGNRYGTSRQTIDQNIEQGKDVVFDIDWQGGTRLKSMYPQDAVMVFVLPPSMDDLAQRLRTRGTDNAATVARRLAKAQDELTHYGEYDYLITNDNLDRAYEELRSIYIAVHCASRRRARRALQLLDQAREK